MHDLWIDVALTIRSGLARQYVRHGMNVFSLGYRTHLMIAHFDALVLDRAQGLFGLWF